MVSLIERIGNRTVLVDACVPVHLARALRRAGLSVRHMNEINPRMPDTHIEYLIMLPSDVLITHDRLFARFLGPKRAILLRRNDIEVIRNEEWYLQAADVMAGARRSVVPPLLIFLFLFLYLTMVTIRGVSFRSVAEHTNMQWLYTANNNLSSTRSK